MNESDKKRPRHMSDRRRRLLGYLTVTRVELEARDSQEALPLWQRVAWDLLTAAQNALEDRDMETGYAALQAARRQEILGFGEDQLWAAEVALRNEAKKKLQGTWRGQAIMELLDLRQTWDQQRPFLTKAARDRRLCEAISQAVVTGGPTAEREIGDLLGGFGFPETAVPWVSRSVLVLGGPEPSAEDIVRVLADLGTGLGAARALVQEATWHRDEHGQNEHRKIARQERSLLILGVVLAAALGVLFALSAVEALPQGFGPGMLGAVAGFGAAGGALSAIRSVSRPVGQLRIPEQAAEWRVTLVRPLFGAAAAVGLYPFLAAEIVSIVQNSIPAILAVSFAAGFTERLIVGAVGTVVRRSEEEPAPTRSVGYGP